MGSIGMARHLPHASLSGSIATVLAMPIARVTLRRIATKRRSAPKLLACLLVTLWGLCSCGEKHDASTENLVRGLRAYKVAATTESRLRRFPGVLQPAELSRLSFEIAGQLKAVNLETGQKVRLGDVLMEIDPRSLQAQVEQASAGVNQAEAQLANAEADFGRKDELLTKGFTTKAAFDQSKATLGTTRAQLEQARRQLDLATHNLDRSHLLAPFAGTIAGVDVKSFAQVAPGQTVVTLYSDDSFEIAFSAPAIVIQSVKVGQPVEVKVSDRPDLSLTGMIKEIGSKAEQVSAFPVVVRVKNEVPGLNAGMAVEVALPLPLIGGSGGYLVPLSVLAPEGGKDVQGVATVFLYDAGSSTVRKRKVTIGGVRDNRLVVTEGLGPGDLVAAAGVSYLTDGETVRLLPAQE